MISIQRPVRLDESKNKIKKGRYSEKGSKNQRFIISVLHAKIRQAERGKRRVKFLKRLSWSIKTSRVEDKQTMLPVN